MAPAKLDPAHAYMRHPLQPHQLRDRHTRTEDMVVLCHFGVARLEAKDWSLAIDGLVRHPRQLNYDDLQRLPYAEVNTVHQCCGSPLRSDVAMRRVCNVTWGGARLTDILAGCKPDPAARFLWAAGADRGRFQDVDCAAYVKDMPLERAAEDVLVAWRVNGAPLPPEHGFPVRLVIPGYYGTNSVKWLQRFTLAESRASGPFTARWYNDPRRDAAGAPTGETAPLWAIAPEAVIVAPAPDESLPAGQAVEVHGWAWADGGVAAAEVSFDGGVIWQGALIEPPRGRGWQRFFLSWQPQRRGAHELCVRASTADGRSQPAADARNAIHRIAVTVQ